MFQSVCACQSSGILLVTAKKEQSPEHICRETATVFLDTPAVFDHAGVSRKRCLFSVTLSELVNATSCVNQYVFTSVERV